MVPMPVIGLTGGVATGKTLVSDYLIEQGVHVVDADLLSREVVRVGEAAYQDIVDRFGPDFLHEDGSVHREKLAQLIFDSPEKRKALEEIIHPRVYDLAWKKIRSLRQQGRDMLIIFSVPLLFESDHEKEMDQIAVVYADEATQVRRLMQRNGFTESEALKRVSAQMPIDKKREAADYVILNTGTVQETYQQVDTLLSKLRS